MPDELTLWLDYEWIPYKGGVFALAVENDGVSPLMCNRCPCPGPECPVCSVGYPGAISIISANYLEITGIGCGEDCTFTEPHLLGVYDNTEFYQRTGITGCVAKTVDWYYDCFSYYGSVDCFDWELICQEAICDEDVCKRRRSSIIDYCQANGFPCNEQTGWLYPTNNVSAMQPVTMHWITSYFDISIGAYTANLHYLDCSCHAQILVSGEFQSPPSSIAAFGYKFVQSAYACDTGCRSLLMALTIQAQEEGWTLHGEGVLVSRVSSNYSCYDYNTATRAQMCADTGESFILITCDCQRAVVDSNYSLRAYVETYACACFDMRQLLIEYPAMFGVVDISFGDDTVVTNGTGSYWDYLSRNSYGHYCDYRNMYVIFDTTCTGVNTSYPRSIVEFYWDAQLSRAVAEVKQGGPTTMAFVGKIKPFTTYADNAAIWPGSRLDWRGQGYMWYWYRNWNPEEEPCCCGSPSDYYPCPSASCQEPIKVAVEIGIFSLMERPHVSFGPDYTLTLVPGRTEDGCYYSPYWKYDDSVLYCLCYTTTNKGIIVNGQDGFSPCVTLKGYGDIPVGNAISYVAGTDNYPEEDEEICVNVNESMGGCMGADWWEDVMEEYSHEEPSSN